MKLSIPRIPLNTVGRDFAVGDIHGCFTDLQVALDRIGFDPDVDRLFSVGDLVDRGPESDQVVAWLAKPWFHAICGNHDFMTWRSALGNPYPDVNHLEHGGQWLPALPIDVQRRIGEALRALPLAMEIETTAGLIGLVHADCPYDDWRFMRAEQSPDDIECCLWSMERLRRQYTGTVRSVRAVVHGHTTLQAPTVLGNVHYIDTAGWPRGGNFTMLELETLTAHKGPLGTGRRFSPRYNR